MMHINFSSALIVLIEVSWSKTAAIKKNPDASLHVGNEVAVELSPEKTKHMLMFRHHSSEKNNAEVSNF
jgi:hypothetical protein